jgi:hypothetical protein
MWGWLERPDNRWRLARFGAAMNGLKNATPANAVLEGLVTVLHLLHAIISPLNYRFLQGTAGSTSRRARWLSMSGVVSAHTLTLASHHPQLQFVVQDRESVVGDAINVCAINRISLTC